MSNSNLQKIIKLTAAQYETLANGGTVGEYTGLNSDFLYMVQDSVMYQPLDSDLTQIAALEGSGWLKRIGSENSWLLGTPDAHGHSAGVGLVGLGNAGTTGGTYTYKAKLKDETANSADSSKSTSSNGGLYSVEVDKSGYLAVRVPWTDSYTPPGSTYDSRFVKKAGDTITGDINRNAGGTWISARDHCVIKTTKTSNQGDDWHPAVGVKTSSGFWSFGSVGGESLCLSYDTDANYSEEKNESAVINFPSAGSTGTLALTSQLPSVGNGTITIKQSGISDQTFTVNQSGNTTITLNDTTYSHPTYNAVTANYYKIGRNSTGHVVIGDSFTIPSVGNGTITIKQSGLSDQTFTVNQSGNTTINLNDTTYSHPSYSEVSAGLYRIGRDSTGHVVFGNSFSIPTVPTSFDITVTDDILDGTGGANSVKYAPYSSQQSKLSFDTSSNNPTRSDRLNLNGYLYATYMYADKFYAHSDKRLKDNIISPEVNFSDIINNIDIREFTWKKDEEHKKNLGVIAQELREVIPEQYKDEFISGKETDDEYLSVNDSKLVYLVIGALKEQQQEIKELKDRLAKYESK